MKYIHIAGTNGKGSTCSYIAHGLIAAGFRVGKFTSPHVLDVTERITVNDTPIPRELIPELPPDRFFQTLWEVALDYFESQRADFAVIETGIGGLYDCTNAISPILSVITKIGYDHMELLGHTIEEIASHKAGIIKEGVPTVTDPTQFAGAMRVIRETAVLKSSPLHIPTSTSRDPFTQNRIVAAESLRVLGIAVPDFDRVRLPARMQTVCEQPLTIIDGAHNVDAVRAVLHMVDSGYSHDKIIVFGMQKSKDYDACAALLEGRRVIRVNDVNCEAQVAAAMTAAAESAGADDMIFVCGSLYLAGNVLRYFKRERL
jgi:dihydrofolate synthase/folylpolyglutamate synthase